MSSLTTNLLRSARQFIVSYRQRLIWISLSSKRSVVSEHSSVHIQIIREYHKPSRGSILEHLSVHIHSIIKLVIPVIIQFLIKELIELIEPVNIQLLSNNQLACFFFTIMRFWRRKALQLLGLS